MLRRTFLFGSVSASIFANDDAARNIVHRSEISGPALQPESLIFVPEEHGRKKKLPLLLWLHGASLRGADTSMLMRYGPPAVAEKRGEFPFVVLSPQCPPGRLWTEDDGSLIKLVDEAMGMYDTDPKHVYLTGLSMGGGGAWWMGSQYPHRFGAVVPMCGPTQPKDWAAGLRKMPIWVFHGEKDKVVPIKRSKDMVKALRQVGNKPKFTIVKGKGHDITAMYNDNHIYDWMLSKKVKS